MNQGWKLGLIWAEARGRAIGVDGGLPWHLPEDLAHFRETTLQAPVVMGRRTWESLPERFRPLPKRHNIVVTRQADAAFAGATLASSLGDAMESLGEAPSADAIAWVIGGGELYRAAMPVATQLVVTQLDLEVPDADTFAPVIDDQWQLDQAGDDAWQVSANGTRYRIRRWSRRQRATGVPFPGSPVA